MKSLIILFAVLFICSPRDVNSQVSQEWAKRLNSSGTSNDYVHAMTYDAAGNVYVTGAGGSNYLTVKYSPEGTVLWQAVYNGPANDADYGTAIAVDATGNVYVTGRSFGNSTGTDFATIKYDAAGTQLWLQRYNGTNNDDDSPVSICVDAAGNVYAGGWASRTTTGLDFAIVKYSAAGSQVWARNYSGPGSGNDFMNMLVIDASGNLYATGSSRGATNDDYATVKYSSAGTLLWSVRYEGSGVDEGTALTVDLQGNVIVTGSSVALNGKDYTTIKYNNAGVQQWLKRYNRTASTEDEPVGLVSDNTGNIYVTGYCEGLNTTSLDYVTLKYNPNGDQQWVKIFNSGLVGVDDKASSIDIDQLGNIYVTGTTISSGSDVDYGTVKYSPAGDVLWSVLYESNLSGNDNAKIVKCDNNGNVYVSGHATGSVSGLDYLTVKYSQPIGITPISTEVPEGFSLGQNYPNPFNPVTNIALRIARFGFVSLKVFDITGKEIAVLVNENLNAGTYNVDFDASHLASGTYFYRLVVGDNTNNGGSFTDVKKMIVVK